MLGSGKSGDCPSCRSAVRHGRGSARRSLGQLAGEIARYDATLNKLSPQKDFRPHACLTVDGWLVTIDRIASFFVEDLLLEDKLRTPEEIIKSIEKVNLADIKRVSQQIFVVQVLNLAMIGPDKNEIKFEKILKI